MKRIFTLLMIVLITLTVAGCGSSKKEEPTETNNDTPPVEETEKEPTDEEIINQLTETLVGEWHYPGIDDEKLIFNADNTGKHDGVMSKQDFTYTVSVEHLEYANNGSYLEYYLNMKYDTGEEEDIIFFFNDERGTMGFHNSDNGGYGGVLGFEEWKKVN